MTNLLLIPTFLYIIISSHSNFKNFSPIKKFQKVWKSHSTKFNTIMKILSTLISNKTRMFAWRNTSTSFQTNWIKIWTKFIRIEYWVRKSFSIKIKLLQIWISRRVFNKLLRIYFICVVNSFGENQDIQDQLDHNQGKFGENNEEETEREIV